MRCATEIVPVARRQRSSVLQNILGLFFNGDRVFLTTDECNDTVPLSRSLQYTLTALSKLT
jgi:hypothetical protein